jgi:hypothetical protein
MRISSFPSQYFKREAIALNDSASNCKGRHVSFCSEKNKEEQMEGRNKVQRCKKEIQKEVWEVRGSEKKEK